MSTITKECLQRLICAIDSENYDEEEIVDWVNSDEIMELARIALASFGTEPVAWSVGGIATHDKKWAARRSEEDNLLMEPLYRHPIITGIDENHYDPELEPGLYVTEIMTKGGAAIINGYYAAPRPLTTSERAELENYRSAQQVVPDEMDLLTCHLDGVTETYSEGCNACRAAMLQGAYGNSPVIPDGWVACSERMPENKPGSYEYLVFESLNNVVHHDYWNVPDVGDDCQFTPFWNHYGRYVTHWMALPAAPQQEI